MCRDDFTYRRNECHKHCLMGFNYSSWGSSLSLNNQSFVVSYWPNSTFETNLPSSLSQSLKSAQHKPQYRKSTTPLSVCLLLTGELIVLLKWIVASCFNEVSFSDHYLRNMIAPRSLGGKNYVKREKKIHTEILCGLLIFNFASLSSIDTSSWTVSLCV